MSADISDLGLPHYWNLWQKWQLPASFLKCPLTEVTPASSSDRSDSCLFLWQKWLLPVPLTGVTPACSSDRSDTGLFLWQKWLLPVPLTEVTPAYLVAEMSTDRSDFGLPDLTCKSSTTKRVFSVILCLTHIQKIVWLLIFRPSDSLKSCKFHVAHLFNICKKTCSFDFTFVNTRFFGNCSPIHLSSSFLRFLYEFYSSLGNCF